MKIVIFLIVLLLSGQSCLANESPQEEADHYLFEFIRVLSSDDQKDLKVQYLVAIDIGIRKLIKSGSASNILPIEWKNEYQKIGLTTNHWSGSYEYNGVVLEKALSIDSQYMKEYTLFAEMHTGRYCWVDNPENIDAGLRYLVRFPDGPFVTEVYYNLGGFFWSRYNDLSELVSYDGTNEGYYAAMIDGRLLKGLKLEDRSLLVAQRDEAKKKSTSYWLKYVEAESYKKAWVLEMLAKMKEGQDIAYGTFSCPD